MNDNQLKTLRTQFLDFELSAEQARGRRRYLARSRHPGLNPRVVITSDVDELCAILLLASPSRSAPWEDLQSANRPDQGQGEAR